MITTLRLAAALTITQPKGPIVGLHHLFIQKPEETAKLMKEFMRAAR